MTPGERAPRRRGWRAALASTDTCLSVEDMSRFADGSLPSEETARAATHLASCFRCGTELLLLKDFESAATHLDEVATVDWVTAQIQRRSRGITRTTPDSVAGSRRAASSVGKRWRQRIGSPRRISTASLVFAAALVVIVAVLYLRSGREPMLPSDGARGPMVLRSTEVVLLAPAGDLKQDPAELRWRAAPRAVVYAIKLMEVDQTELWKAESTQTSIALPAAVRAKMIPGKTFLWQVTALDAAGKAVTASPIERFRIAISRSTSEH